MLNITLLYESVVTTETRFLHTRNNFETFYAFHMEENVEKQKCH